MYVVQFKYVCYSTRNFIQKGLDQIIRVLVMLRRQAHMHSCYCCTCDSAYLYQRNFQKTNQIYSNLFILFLLPNIHKQFQPSSCKFSHHVAGHFGTYCIARQENTDTIIVFWGGTARHHIIHAIQEFH